MTNPITIGRRVIRPLAQFASWVDHHLRQPPAPPKLKSPRAPKVHTDVTPEELRAIAAISPATIRYGCGSAAKRFARDIQGTAKLTNGQRDYLWAVAYRHRKQIADREIVKIAEGKVLK